MRTPQTPTEGARRAVTPAVQLALEMLERNIETALRYVAEHPTKYAITRSNVPHWPGFRELRDALELDEKYGDAYRLAGIEEVMRKHIAAGDARFSPEAVGDALGGVSFYVFDHRGLKNPLTELARAAKAVQS